MGKTVVPWVRQGLDEYVSRLGHYVPFEVKEIPELKGVSSLSEAQIKEKEGALILKAAGQADMILLDEKGVEYRSVEFAEALRKRLAHATKDLAFVVGGAYGFSAEVYAKASGKISLSKMTFPHQLARVLLLEQLYRACKINAGERYHK